MGGGGVRPLTENIKRSNHNGIAVSGVEYQIKIIKIQSKIIMGGSAKSQKACRLKTSEAKLRKSLQPTAIM